MAALPHLKGRYVHVHGCTACRDTCSTAVAMTDALARLQTPYWGTWGWIAITCLNTDGLVFVCVDYPIQALGGTEAASAAD